MGHSLHGAYMMAGNHVHIKYYIFEIPHTSKCERAAKGRFTLGTFGRT